MIEYIYDPKIVDAVLRSHPLIRQRLKSPAREGKKAISFPQTRKTGREIYRILSNQNYPHLVDLIDALEYCLINGYEQPQLLKTRMQTEFDSAEAELFVATYFLRRGFAVQGFNQGKGTTSIPDMFVESGTLSVIVEVYCPRDWAGLRYFIEDLRLGILHLDVALDFYFTIIMQEIDQFDHEGELLWFDPWRFSEANENPNARFANIKQILSELQIALSSSVRSEVVASLPYKNLNVLTEVHLEQIQKSQARMPSRSFSISAPTLSGYAPEGMFDQLVERRILNKIRKGQAQSMPGGHLRMLVVDVSQLEYTHEFTHPYYLQQFGQSVKKHLDPEAVDVDMVVFCFSRSEARADMAIPVLFRKPSLSEEVFSKLYGGNRSFNALSKEVFIEHRADSDT